MASWEVGRWTRAQDIMKHMDHRPVIRIGMGIRRGILEASLGGCSGEGIEVVGSGTPDREFNFATSLT
jgi:hypothetical protein